jgi:hypothetical protein
LVVFLATVPYLACSYDVSLYAPGDPSAPPDTGNVGGPRPVQRADLTLTVTVSGPDSALAAAVGSPGGILRNAFVTLELPTTTFRASDTTDAAGQAGFADLLPGRYVVSVARLLTPEEIAVLPPADQDVNAFGGGAGVSVNAPSTAVQVGVAAGRRGSLVISEIFNGAPYFPNGTFYFYYFGMYVELYNNSDTTISLTGKSIALSQVYFRDFSPPRTCPENERWWNDPEGIWAQRYLDAFPPGATVAPGQAVLVATDAIDHSVIVPTMHNLTHANFEYIGSNDVDNPSVPNMVVSELGEFGAGLLGHGWSPWSSFGALILAESLTVSTLVRDPQATSYVVRIPRDKILDVFSSGDIPELEAANEAAGFELCQTIVHPDFDRQYANLLDDRDPQRSVRRRVFATLPNGRVILIRTRSSRNDFEAALPSPGSVP